MQLQKGGFDRILIFKGGSWEREGDFLQKRLQF